MLKLTLKAFRAPEEPELCQEFVRQHRKVLEDFGISNVTTNNEHWLDDPNAIIIVALNEEFGMMGGIRLQLATEGRVLPMEEAIAKLDPQVKQALEELRPHGNGEVCSLWPPGNTHPAQPGGHRHLRSGRGRPHGVPGGALHQEAPEP